MSREPELKTAEEVLKKHPAPWSYEEWNGDILDANGHYIMAVYDDGIAEIILRSVNSNGK